MMGSAIGPCLADPLKVPMLVTWGVKSVTYAYRGSPLRASPATHIPHQARHATPAVIAKAEGLW